MFIAIIMGIIAVTTTAAVAGVALHQGTQIMEFVQNWQSNAEKLWEQSETDSQLHAEIADLESAVVMLGDQLQSLRQQMTLKCD
jgi:cell division protein FtsL